MIWDCSILIQKKKREIEKNTTTKTMQIIILRINRATFQLNVYTININSQNNWNLRFMIKINK